jgi:hypothetical protein
MVQFITDKKNQPQFENVELDVNLENGKWRTPLHVAFTPPVETFCARRFGVDAKGLPLAKKPDGDVSDLEWIRPGTAEDRQKIVACLIKRKCDLNKVDYHDHSALHYACVWGWVPTVDLLLEEGADPECSNIGALAASCHRCDSWPSHDDVGGFVFEFERVSGEIATRSHDAVRTASNSKKKLPTSIIPRDDARRWREGAAAPRDAEIYVTRRRPERAHALRGLPPRAFD